MEKETISVYEKNDQSEKTQFKLEIPQEKQDLFKKNLKDERGIFFNIIEEFETEKEGFLGYRLSTTDYIGIFVFPDNPPIIIKPKVRQADFLEMLRYVELDNFFLFDKIISYVSKEDNFLKVIIKMFLNQLQLLFRNPIKKNYKESINVRKSIKGKILISETIKNMNILSGDVVCEYEIFTRNNIHNRIIKHTLSILRHISPEDLIMEINAYLRKLKSVALVRFKDADFNRLNYNRLTERYKIIHNFCRMIIKRFSSGIKSGRFQCYSFLFYSSSVYEIFLRSIIKEFLGLKGFKVFKYSDEKIQPDIVIEKYDRIMLVCDAKYKFYFQRNTDYRELLDYITELDKLRKFYDKDHRNGILIYPLSGDNHQKLLKYHFKIIEKDFPRKKKEILWKDYQKDFERYKNDGKILIKDKVQKDFLLEDFRDLLHNLYLVETGKDKYYYAYLIDLSQIANKKYLENWINFLNERFLQI